MTNSTSDEREQRLKQIRERSESRKRVAGRFQWVQVSTQEWSDIDFLLSLIDSEAAGSYVYIPPVVSHADCCRGAEIQHASVSAVPTPFEDGHACADCCPCPDCGLVRAEQYDTDPTAWPDASRPGWKRNAATSMRSLCVEKVKETARHYDGLAATEYDQPAAIASVLRKMAYALESVTPELDGAGK